MYFAKINASVFNLSIIRLIIFYVGVSSVFSLQCKDEENRDVDWFVAYKLPKNSLDSHDLIKEGEAYLYITSDTINSGWTVSKFSIGSQDSIAAKTLAPLYDKSIHKSSLWLLYNDQPPNESPKFNDGHSKGALITNSDEGFWMIHSVPKFPPKPSPDGSYAYPDTGKKYGQSFLCISLDTTQFHNIGKQLQYNEAIVYQYNIPSELRETYKTLVDVAGKHYVKNPPFNNKINFVSKAGQKFISFAKSQEWDRELYKDFMAPELNDDFYVETWLNGRGHLPSNCSNPRVMNVKSISLKSIGLSDGFPTSDDHSKWALSLNKNSNNSYYICIGDINHDSDQSHRGGGTACFNRKDIWQNYKSLINRAESCKDSPLLN